MLKLVRWFSGEKRAIEFQHRVSVASLEGPSLIFIYRGSKADGEIISNHVHHVLSYDVVWAFLIDSDSKRAFYSVRMWLR